MSRWNSAGRGANTREPFIEAGDNVPKNEPLASFEIRILEPVERLFDALCDPSRGTRIYMALLIAFLILWTLYGVLAHEGLDVNPDVGEALLWSRQPALAHHPPMMDWIYRL